MNCLNRHFLRENGGGKQKATHSNMDLVKSGDHYAAIDLKESSQPTELIRGSVQSPSPLTEKALDASLPLQTFAFGV